MSSTDPRVNPSGDWRRERRNGLGLPQLLNVLWGRRVLVATVVGVLALVAVIYGLLREPAYTAEAVVNVEPQ